MHTRPIPCSGEALPVIGLGTYVGFDVPASSPKFAKLPGVLDALFDAGGSVIDSSPMYGQAEATAGSLLSAPRSGPARPAPRGDSSKVAKPHLLESALPARPRAFIATKVWTRGRDAGVNQMQHSIKLLQTQCIDLMQVHNLLDWKIHLATLRAWKEAGRIRYLGVTHYTSSAYPELEAVLRSEPLDFVQLNYSVADRAAEQRLLPLAAERGVAVLVNLPLGSGAVLRSVQRAALPAFAAELECTSWAQLLLKYVIGHPAVTCAIPGTGQAAHMADNALAGKGVMPDEAMRQRILQCWNEARG
jgi:aryl-alcohol dehydrogenase-like predicted oxidoreductase